MNAFGKILSITLGGVLGGTIGYFVTNLIVYKAEEYVFGMEETPELEEKVVENEEEEIQPLSTFSEDEKRIPKNYSTSKISLDSLVSKYESSTSKEEEKDEPYLLTEEEYQNDNGNVPQESLIYWAKDDQLTDIYNELIENPKKMVGSTTLTKFGFIKSDPDILYVRNNKRYIDYEISKVEKSYSVEIMGVDEEVEPPKPPKRKPRVRKTNEDSDDE